MAQASSKAATNRAALITFETSATSAKDMDLDLIRDPKQRKKIQNRIAQRNYRKKIKERLESFDHWQESMANVFPQHSRPIHLVSQPADQHNSVDDEMRQDIEPAVPESWSAHSLSLDSIPAQTSLSWSPTLATYLATKPSTTDTICAPDNIPTPNSALELQKNQQENFDLSAANTSPSRDKERGTSITVESQPSITCSAGGPKDEWRRSLEQLSGPDDGKTALHLAAEKGDHPIVRILLDHMDDALVQDQLGRTALYLAVENTHEKTVELLLTKGRGINVQDHDGQTALHVAVAAGEEAMIEMLLGAGADLELKDVTGRTALHIAAQVGCEKVMQQLLGKGADAAARVG